MARLPNPSHSSFSDQRSTLARSLGQPVANRQALSSPEGSEELGAAARPVSARDRQPTRPASLLICLAHPNPDLNSQPNPSRAPLPCLSFSISIGCPGFLLPNHVCLGAQDHPPARRPRRASSGPTLLAAARPSRARSAQLGHQRSSSAGSYAPVYGCVGLWLLLRSWQGAVRPGGCCLSIGR
jgi:hypothetical protein